MIEVRLLSPAESGTLERVAGGVFDGRVLPEYAEEFLADPRHHLAVAIADGEVVGMASAVHYVHPDKPTALWINEVGVDPTFARRGLASRLLNVLFEVGAELGCTEAWVLTEEDNAPANGLYQSLNPDRVSRGVVMYEWTLPDQRTEPGA